MECAARMGGLFTLVVRRAWPVAFAHSHLCPKDLSLKDLSQECFVTTLLFLVFLQEIKLEVSQPC